MPSDSGSTTSAWLTHAVPAFPALTEDTSCDVCVIGGGIAGLTTAYLLSLEGRSVVVLEDGAIGSGETGRTTAPLTWALDDRYFNLEKLFGAEISPGSGAVMRRGLGKIAVFRDSGNGIHAFSALCPHLGCVVRWNHAEETSDCPCHGSRFSAHGEVVNGPANRNLEPAERETVHAEP
jgi:glycine/D-amino acid oxidase-like deaminating enzyme